MTKYLITYDLVGTDETSDDYKALIQQIKTYSIWGKVRAMVIPRTRLIRRKAWTASPKSPISSARPNISRSAEAMILARGTPPGAGDHLNP